MTLAAAGAQYARPATAGSVLPVLVCGITAEEPKKVELFIGIISYFLLSVKNFSDSHTYVLK